MFCRLSYDSVSDLTFSNDWIPFVTFQMMLSILMVDNKRASGQFVLICGQLETMHKRSLPNFYIPVVHPLLIF